MGAIRTRLEALEREARPASSVTLDLSRLSHVEFEVRRCALDLLRERQITEKEAAEMCRCDVIFPYPIYRQATCSLVPYIRVRINRELVWLQWFGWPGTWPDGYQYCTEPVRPDGVFPHARSDLPTKHRDPRWPIQWGTYRQSEVQT